MENETKKSNEPRALTVETRGHVDSFNLVETWWRCSWRPAIHIYIYHEHLPSGSRTGGNREKWKFLNPNSSKLFLWWQWQCTSKDVTYIIYFVHSLSLYGTTYLFLYPMQYWLWRLWLSQNWGHSAAVCCSVCIQGWGVHNSSWEPNDFQNLVLKKGRVVGIHREEYRSFMVDSSRN